LATTARRPGDRPRPDCSRPRWPLPMVSRRT
jgi:hypothetical protein